jgi:prepilin-type N-terminal cleavage/methylation domain-containing protein/prepilin-type processing-associated H-X9-DG protein
MYFYSIAFLRRPRLFKLHHFTLIELLVVLSIISVLLAIILPVMNKAKKKVYEIACINNLKQIGIGALEYCEYSDGYVLPADMNDIGGYRNWINYMSDQIVKRDEIFKCPELNSEECFNPYGGGNMVKEASYVMNTVKEGEWGTTATIKSSPEKSSGWGFNTFTPHRMNQISSLSTKIFILDFQECDESFNSSADARGIVHFEESDHGPYGYGTLQRDAGWHHQGKFNALMGDSHVESIKKTEDEQWVVFSRGN